MIVRVDDDYVLPPVQRTSEDGWVGVDLDFCSERRDRAWKTHAGTAVEAV